MTVTSGPAVHSAAGTPDRDEAATAGGAFTRLNPVDGLFLRGQHLDLMQGYTSALAAALGAGVGPGVVSGFKCTLSQGRDAVQVTGGLAIAGGMPLCSTTSASVSLKTLTAGPDNFWVVEIRPASWLFGSEPVYGGLCEDPCGQGSGIRPFAEEGIELHLRRDSMPGLGDQTQHVRNWLASQYFERERRYGGESSRSPNAPWLLPNAAGGPVQPLGDRPWADGTGSYDDTAVPLGVVWKDVAATDKDESWELDVWTARRDTGDPVPSAAWQWRLGWRPHSVFVAQILQFQAELAHVDLGQPPEQPRHVKEAVKQLKRASETAMTIRSPKMPAVLTEVDEARRVLEGGDTASLPGAGFDELPPAGFLPVTFDSKERAEGAAKDIFGGIVEVRVRECRADYIAHAVEQVQHMDRIPLVNPDGPSPQIDFLIPQAGRNDLKVTRPANDWYGWSAFVRRRDDAEQAEAQLQDVDVYVVRDHSAEEFGRYVKRFDEDRTRRKLMPIGVIKLPFDTWALPVEARASWDLVRDEMSEGDHVVGVLGVVNKPERLPLAAVRASMFMTPEQELNDDQVQLPATYVLAADMPEAIVVALGDVPPE